MYKRIASASSPEQLHELQVETIDRFGLIPDAAKNLFSIAQLKLKSARHDIKSVEAGPTGGVIKFQTNPNINVDGLMRAIAAQPQEYKFSGTETIQVSRSMPDSEHRIKMIEDVIELISND